MNYVKSLNLFGVEAKEIPCITGTEAPTTSTEGAVGLLYMDTTTGDLYKCTKVAGDVHTWEAIESGGGEIDTALYDVTAHEITGVVNAKKSEEKASGIEYLGLCQAALQGGKIVFTPSNGGTANATRIYYKIEAKPGDVICIQPTSYWTEENYAYEPLSCTDDYTLIHSPTFATVSGTIRYTIPLNNTGTTCVLLGLRSPTKQWNPPNQWGVVDNAFDKAFIITHIDASEAESIHYGHYIIVGRNGKLCVGAKSELINENAEIKTPWINVAHRGYPNGVRENTIPAFYEGVLDGCNMFECDIRMTSDNVPVLCHDETITGTKSGTSSTLTIASSTYSALSELVLTTSAKYGDVKIPKLEDVLKFMRHYGLKATLELKVVTDACIEAVVALVKKYNMSENVLFFTQLSPQASIQKVFSLDEQARAIFYYSADMSYIEGITTDTSKIVIAITESEVNDTAVNAIRNKRYKIWGWGVSSHTSGVLSYLPDYVEYTTGTSVTNLIGEYANSVKFW